jgi:hypothetical protein
MLVTVLTYIALSYVAGAVIMIAVAVYSLATHAALEGFPVQFWPAAAFAAGIRWPVFAYGAVMRQYDRRRGW